MTTYRVMIVDDEAIFRTGLTHLHDWSKEGIEVVAQAANGMEALELIDKVKPHVVITDIMMPIMDGIDLVKNLRKKYPSIKIIILSSFSEFELVREVFKYGVDDYLLKPKVTAEELVTLIQNSCEPSAGATSRDSLIPLLKEPAIIVSQWFEQDEQLSEEDKQELIRTLSGNQFTMLVTSITVLQSLTNSSQYELEQFILHTSYEQFQGFSYITVFTKNHVAIIINHDIDDEARLKPAIIQFVKKVNEQYKELKFIHASPLAQMEQLKEKYAALQQSLNKAIYFSNRSIILENEIRSEQKEVNFDHEAFVNSLKWLTFNQAKEQLDQYFIDVKQLQALDEYSLKRFIQHIIYTIMSTLEHLKLPFTEQSSEKLIWFKKIDLASTIDELENIVTQFLEMVQEQFNQHNEHNEVNLLNQIIDHIHEHYDQDISLSELADKFHMNYSYLSWYFKHRTNENMTAYINKVRIEKAKELLKYTDDTISQISSKIGFSEHNYFSKVFKKFTGMTPVEYRNTHSTQR